jgi:hypothetical protein
MVRVVIPVSKHGVSPTRVRRDWEMRPLNVLATVLAVVGAPSAYTIEVNGDVSPNCIPDSAATRSNRPQLWPLLERSAS